MSTAADQLEAIARARTALRAAEDAEREAARVLKVAKAEAKKARLTFDRVTNAALDELRQPSLFTALETAAEAATVPTTEGGGRGEARTDADSSAEHDAQRTPALPPVKTWRDMTLEAAGFTQGDDSFEEEVCAALVEAGVQTCGELADRLLGGEMFDLSPRDLDPVYAAVEMLSEDDEHPIDFDAHFGPLVTPTVQPSAEPADRPKQPLHEQLRAALHGTEGAADRWAKRRETGLSDADLKLAIGEEFGSGGRLGGGYDYQTKGGKGPEFRCPDVHRVGTDRKPTLAGSSLIRSVRSLLEIPLPEKAAKKAKVTKVMLASGPATIVSHPDTPVPGVPTAVKLTAIDGFPDAVADLLAPATTTLDTLLERVEDKIRIDLPRRNKLVTFFVNMGAKLQAAEHAADAVTKHLGEPAAPEPATADKSLTSLSQPDPAITGLGLVASFPKHILPKLVKAGIATTVDLTRKADTLPLTVPYPVRVYAALRAVKGVSSEAAHKAAGAVLYKPTGMTPLELERAAEKLKPAAEAKPYGWEITYLTTRSETKRCHYVGTEANARRKAKLQTGYKTFERAEPFTEAAWVRAFGRGRM